MSVVAWFYTVWLIIDMVMFIAGLLMIVIGGLGREQGERAMTGETIRQLTGVVQERRVRRARAHKQVQLEDDMADIRAEREHARQ